MILLLKTFEMLVIVDPFSIAVYLYMVYMYMCEYLFFTLYQFDGGIWFDCHEYHGSNQSAFEIPWTQSFL